MFLFTFWIAAVAVVVSLIVAFGFCNVVYVIGSNFNYTKCDATLVL